MRRRPDASPWGRRSLQTRVMLLVGMGMLAALSILGGAGWTALSAVTSGLESERQLLADSVGRHVSFVLQEDLQVLQSVSSSLVGSPAAGPSASRDALRDAYLRARLLDRVFVIGPTRTVLGVEPPEPAGHALPAPDADAVEAAFGRGRPVVTRVSGTGRDLSLYLLVPLRNWKGQVVAIAAGEVVPSGPRFSSVLDPVRVSPAITMDLVDASGIAIASSAPSRRLTRLDEATTIREKLEHLEAPISLSAGAASHDVVVLAGVAGAPWGIVLRQPEPQAFADARTHRRWILWLGPTLLLASLLLAWGAGRSVRQPLVALTNAAEQIARGDLEQAVPVPPEDYEDEVGRLARWLERMRIALRASIEHVERTNAELEQRVQDRTQELRGLYLQLQEREEWREELLRKVISAQEDERRRLARELHDETSQTLSALNMKIETALAAWPADASRDRLAEARELAVRTLGELHRLIFDLRPSVLDDLGLVSAIRWYAERHLEPRGIAVRCEFSGFDDRLSPELETALFRVVQEAITNIAKHSGADSVLVQGLAAPDRITFEIEDDGHGFDPASLPPPAARERGLGLLGMRERVELFGGTLELESAPGQGTRIVVTAPVHQEVGHVEDSRPHRG